MQLQYGLKAILLTILLTILLSYPEGLHAAIPEKPDPSRCASRYPSDNNFAWECIKIKRNETLEKLFGDAWKDVARLNRTDRRHAVPGTYIKAPVELPAIKDFTPMPKEYPPASSEAKFILVDLSEQFLGAYEYGKLVFSMPVATGEEGNETPTGSFRITAYNRNHRSSKYFMEKTARPYPMNYGLRFYVNRDGVSYWLHGRDMPGRPASHGCIGLYDEEMQKKYYGFPKDPALEDAKTLYQWVLSALEDDGRFHILKEGPRLLIVGRLK